jgi:hypothetical protein
LNAERPPAPDDWGRAIVERLFTSASAGGSDLVREYSERLDIATSPALLVDLVLAYWLERVAYLTGFIDRRESSWLDPNVRLVLDAAERIVPMA